MIGVHCGDFDMRYKLATRITRIHKNDYLNLILKVTLITSSTWPTLLKEETKLQSISIDQAEENNFSMDLSYLTLIICFKRKNISHQKLERPSRPLFE